MDGKAIGVALGGGGVRGLAHIPLLEVMDSRGLRPAAIAGTSMGAVIGALYASGQSGSEIRAGIEKHIVTGEDGFRDILGKTPTLLRWLKAVRLDMGRGGFLRADGFLKYLLTGLEATRFEELSIPLSVVATDFWSGEQVVFSSGELLPAIRASMAIPGIFAPVVADRRVLVDGGIANNVPYELLMDRCDCTIAVDVAPTRTAHGCEIPGVVDAVLGMFDMLVEKVTEGKRRHGPPTIYIKPELVGVRVLDFDKIEDVFRQAGEAIPRLEAELDRHCGRRNP